jgi:SAM-dependent methyltransferase
MGLDVHALRVLQILKFDEVADRRKRISRVLTLGRQELTREVAYKFEPRTPRAPAFSKSPKYAEPLIQSIFQGSSVDSLDVSDYEGASLIGDLNVPNPEVLAGRRFDLILDFGTLEHVYNLPNALTSIEQILALGGTIVHLVPSNGFSGHGLYQFSPSLFQEIYSKKNGFTCQAFLIKMSGLGHKKFWWKVAESSARHDYGTLYPTYVLVVATKLFQVSVAANVFQPDYEDLWVGQGAHSESASKTEVGIVRRLAKRSVFEGSIEDAYVSFSSFRRNLQWWADLTLSTFPWYFSSNNRLQRIPKDGVGSFSSEA